MLARAGELPLRAFLAPIAGDLADPDLREIVVNRPGEVGIERRSGWTWKDVPEFTAERLDQIGILAGWLMSKDLEPANPICMTSLPGGQRCTIVRAPAVETVSVTIRNLPGDERSVFDADFTALMNAAEAHGKKRSQTDERLLSLYRAKAWPEFFSLAVKSHKTIAATGSTGSGKTSLLRRLMREIPADERLVTIEDTNEFGALPQRNRVSMFFGSASVTAEDAVIASLRMRPDRVAMQELRGKEAFAYVRLLAAGHPGGLTTWHADSADPFSPLLLMTAGCGIPDDKVLAIMRSFIDIVAFCKRDEGGFSVPSVWFRGAEEGAS